MLGLLWKSLFLKKVGLELPYDQAIPLLRVYPREMKMYVHIKTFTQVFIVTHNSQKVETTHMSIN